MSEGKPGPDEQELYAQIDREAADDRERTASKALYRALKENRQDISGQAQIPDDPRLSERILAEARTRSAQISAASRRAEAEHQSGGIPWWLWLAWALAVAGFAAAWLALK